MAYNGPIWHPYTQHKTTDTPLKVIAAKDASIYLEDGRVLIDAISSWWVNTYGHGNEAVAQSVYEQILQLEQVIFAGFTHEPALQLATKILDLLPGNFSKVFFSDNGSTAVEVAMKMAIQYHYNQAIPRTRIIALEGAYHGDTFGAMSASEKGKFFQAFEPYNFEVSRIPVPLAGKEEDSLQKLEALLMLNDSACFIFEPLVQGAAGMIMYSPEVLDKMLALCNKYNTLTIADEVMTGFGRTGKNFAIEHLENSPAIICLSKGLTAGVLPMSLTVCEEKIYQAFYDNDISKTLYHGHSYTGNAVGCAAALAGLSLLLSDEMQQNIKRISKGNLDFLESIKHFKNLSRIQTQGTILSIELDTGRGADYFSDLKTYLTTFFLDRNILMRPLGNVLYIMPPYCITDTELSHVYQTIYACLEQLNNLKH